MKYTVICTNINCKKKQIYEGQTFGDCMELSERDGWENTGRTVKCGKCKS